MTQNKCIGFCLNMVNRDHIIVFEFRKINWLPTKERFEQCVLVNIYKFFNSSQELVEQRSRNDVQYVEYLNQKDV